MSRFVLVDTSVFIQYLRGKENDSLAVLVLRNHVLLSAVVRLELLAGVRNSDLQVLQKLLSSLRNLHVFPEMEVCESLLNKVRSSGLFGGIADLLILADVITHRASLFTYDGKMKSLAQKLGIRLFEG